MVPGRTYVYPLTLLSNQGYSGTIKLSLTSAPPDPTLTYRFEPESVELSEISTATLTVATTKESSPALHMLSVRGTDAADRSNALCLQLNERKTGGIQVVSVRPPESKPTKNLEIVLDVSGSMKLPLGNKTRWATALEVLKSVVEKLPDDFNVGLRAYAHRHPAKSPKTCTDTELLLPIEKLNRSRILTAVGKLKPRGETPLIYSILQAPADLKARGGGSIVVITDGEDTCKGDPIAAAKQLKESGVDVTLNIVGFTLTGKKVQEQLTTLAESSGGRYYGAQSGEALARALYIAAVDKFPYTIFDASGKQVAKGDAGALAEELEPGQYRVSVKAADEELTEQVTVTSGGEVVLRVAIKGDKFVLER
jgi:Mg-chelatase subunit ChlD